MKRASLLAAIAAFALGCAAAPPPAAPVAQEPEGPALHLVLTQLEPTNVGHQVIDADVESWPRPGSGPVLYASPSGQDGDCTPNVTVLFAKDPVADAQYRVGDDVQLFIEAQCGEAGEVRSWRGVSGMVTIAAQADGYRVHVAKVRMQPSGGDNAGYGTFVADGMGSGVTLHAS